MADYLPRIADNLIRSALATFGAVIIQGPRAGGKTTTGLQHAASSVRMDASPDLIALAETAPAVLLAGEVPRLVDEWQLAPGLWNAVRHEIDDRGRPGQFILTGSATPKDDATRHSGAGRFKRITLRPMTLAESGDSARLVPFSALFQGGAIAGVGGPTVPDYAALIVRGGWPTLIGQPDRSATDYLDAYLDDTARVDIAAGGSRVDPVRMQGVIRAVARNLATEAPATKIAAEAELTDPGRPAGAVSAQTARRYLDALTRVFVLEEQPAWTPHLRSAVRLRVSPKWHFVDPSIAAATLATSGSRLLGDPATLGLFFESLCIRDLRVYAQVMGGKVLHYRDETGLKVDAIVEFADGRWAAFEIKLGGPTAIESAARNLAKLAAKVSDDRRASLLSLNVITGGTASLTRPDGINVVALGHLTGGGLP